MYEREDEQRVIQYGIMQTKYINSEYDSDDEGDIKWTTYCLNHFPLIDISDCLHDNNFDIYDNIYFALKKIKHIQSAEFSWMTCRTYLLGQPDNDTIDWLNLFYKAISINPYAIVPLPNSIDNSVNKLLSLLKKQENDNNINN